MVFKFENVRLINVKEAVMNFGSLHNAHGLQLAREVGDLAVFELDELLQLLYFQLKDLNCLSQLVNRVVLLNQNLLVNQLRHLLLSSHALLLCLVSLRMMTRGCRCPLRLVLDIAAWVLSVTHVSLNVVLESKEDFLNSVRLHPHYVLDLLLVEVET